MFVLFRIAFRNLRQHRSKSLIIGTIIMLGVIILIVGNSLMDTADRGIEKAFVENFTADVMISGQSRGTISLFGVRSPGGIEETPIIPDYEKVRAWVDAYPGVELSTPQISGAASIKVEGQADPEKRSYSFLIGVEPDTYNEMFTTTTLVEGRYLEPGEEGIVISEDNRNTIEERLGMEIGIGDPVLLTSFGNRGIKIREVPVVGIFNFEQFSDGMEMISYIDTQTLRSLKGMTVGNLSEVELDAEDTLFLDSGSDDTSDLGFDDFFSDDALSFETAESEDLLGDDLFNILDTDEETEERIEAANELDTGAWEYLLLRMDNNRHLKNFMKDITVWFEQEDIAAQAGNWKAAAGPFATSADVVRIIFNIVVLLVVFVAVLIVINTLVISVVERTGEIGTMRALGAQKSFIRNLFNIEISTIVFVFGGLGILLALGILGIVTLVRIPATNSLLEILFAGSVLIPVVRIQQLAITFVAVFVVGLLANIYPLSVALKVQPIEAMRDN